MRLDMGMVMVGALSCPSYLLSTSSSLRLMLKVCSSLCVSSTRFWYFWLPWRMGFSREMTNAILPPSIFGSRNSALMSSYLIL